MTQRVRLIALVIAFGNLDAQPQPGAVEFDVVSVKPNKTGDPGMSIHTNKGLWRATNMTAQSLIVNAYEILDEQLVGAPSWIAAESFDIEGKFDDDPAASGSESAKRHRLRLQALLASRFHFEMHRETKEWQSYVLVVGKKGSKLKPSEFTEKTFSMSAGNGHIDYKGGTLQNLAQNLANRLGRPVVDQTGLDGRFDFRLDFEPPDHPVRSDAPGAEAPRPSLFTALQDQLGLKLESKKAPVEMLVIDHIERPTAN